MEYGLSSNSPARMVREEVFMKEQGFENEFDDQDKDSYQFVFYDDGEVVSTSRMFYSKDKPGFMTVGRVAILSQYRSKHYGLEMMAIIEKEAKKLGVKALELSAQCRVQGFYEKAGFHPMEMNIWMNIAHIFIWKKKYNAKKGISFY